MCVINLCDNKKDVRCAKLYAEMLLCDHYVIFANKEIILTNLLLRAANALNEATRKKNFLEL